MPLLLAVPILGFVAAAFAPVRSDAIPLRIVTEPAKHEAGDPAIWIHPTNPTKSLVVGADKDSDGAIYVYDLNGKIVRVVREQR